MSIKTTSVILSALMGAFSSASVRAQACSALELTDVTPLTFNLEYTPQSQFGTTMYFMEYKNIGTNNTLRRIDVSLYELDDNLNRVALILTRFNTSPVLAGSSFGHGGFTNLIQQGKAYEMNVSYPCDTNPANNSEFQVAWNINNPPPDKIFADGMETPPAAVQAKAPALKP